jgi:hypothetical protein
MTEFVVTGTGVTIGSAITDTHSITGSLGITGSFTMSDTFFASGSLSGSLVSLTHLTNTAGNVTSFLLNTSGSAGASSNIMNLQVAGTSSFTVSRTGAVTINTFASNAAFSYTNGGITYLTYQPSNNTLQVGSTSARGTITAAALTLSNSNTSTTAGVISIDNPKTTTAGTVNYVTNTSTIAPTSGTGIFNGYVYAPTINQTGGANGITRGVFISPTLTSAPNFRGIEIGVAPVSIGSNSCVGILVSGSNTRGGAGYIDFLQATNTSASIANPNKFFRLSTTGDLEIVNSNYATVILSLTDAGVFNTPGGGTSDARVKNTITYITSSAYDIISQLKPASFEFNNTPGITRHGFIAQDILKVKPDLVLGDGAIEGGTYGLDYDGILALTVKALQEANNRIDALEQQIGVLKNK